MDKKHIIIAAAAGLIAFTAAFSTTWMIKSSQNKKAMEAAKAAAVKNSQKEEQKSEMPSAETAVAENIPSQSSLTEKQLKSLIYDIREKMAEYNNRLRDFELREQRLKVAQEILKEDITKLDNLRIELATTISNLKEEQEKLLKSRLEIEKSEKTNLITIAATYDRMEAASASQIIINMAKTEDGSTNTGTLDEAVKILHYMTERTKAKLLAELANTEPKYAAVLCQRLKQVTEKE